MFKHGMKFFLAVLVLVFAMFYVPQSAVAIPITDTFTDIAGQGANPGDITLVDEHGGTSSTWAANDAGISIVWSYGWGTAQDLRVYITNTSSHTMWDTVLAFEEDPDWVDWKTTILANNTWDGTDSSGDAAYWFGNIAAGGSAERLIDVRNGESVFSGLGLAYNSQGLDSSGYSWDSDYSNVSVTHAVVPEPVSSTLFIIGGVTLGFRRFRKKRIS